MLHLLDKASNSLSKNNRALNDATTAFERLMQKPTIINMDILIDASRSSESTFIETTKTLNHVHTDRSTK